MIKVEIENNKIEIKGHANYDDYGKDIVYKTDEIIEKALKNIV